jgi:hypothetical protein
MFRVKIGPSIAISSKHSGGDHNPMSICTSGMYSADRRELAFGTSELTRPRRLQSSPQCQASRAWHSRVFLPRESVDGPSPAPANTAYRSLGCYVNNLPKGVENIHENGLYLVY